MPRKQWTGHFGYLASVLKRRVSVSLLCVAVAGEALAQQQATPPARTESALESAPPSQQEAVSWNQEWRGVPLWESALAAGVLAGALVIRGVGPEPPDNWRGGILFDDAVGERARVEDPGLSGSVSRATDYLFYGSMVYRLVDSAIVPAVGYGDLELAAQMAMIDMEAFAFVGGVLWTTQLFVGRRRPEYDTPCGPGATPAELERCDHRNSEFRSFIAGHPATVLTAAGLTCTHHAHVPLYGRDGDILACGLTTGAAIATGAGRLMSGKHYASDVLLGFALGGIAGWGLPWALHYRTSGAATNQADRTAPAARNRRAALTVGVYPWLVGELPGVSAIGVF